MVPVRHASLSTTATLAPVRGELTPRVAAMLKDAERKKRAYYRAVEVAVSSPPK
jgi:hypothetical protein